MMRIVAARAIRSSTQMTQKAFAPAVARNFFWGSKDDKEEVPEIKIRIKTDREQQAGRRKEELDAAERGEEAFDNSSIVPPSDAGSWEKPIEVRTSEDTVLAFGYSCTHGICL